MNSKAMRTLQESLMKLPGVGKALGQSIKEFKQANSDDKTIDVTEQKKLDAEKK